MDLELDPELVAAADEELTLATALFWRDLVTLVPWGDSYEGFGPSGGPFACPYFTVGDYCIRIYDVYTNAVLTQFGSIQPA